MPLNQSKGRLRFKAANESDPSDRGDLQAIQLVAVRLLARREHSAGEIRRKLQSRGYTASGIDAVVATLMERGLLSDLRFVSSFIIHHAQRGHGPSRIRAELRQQGVAPEIIEQQLRVAEVDWDAIAAQVRARKFRSAPHSMTERAKQSRFLQYRGFSAEQIRAAMGRLSDSGESDPEAADIDLES